MDTYNSHRKLRRPVLADRKVYRPVRRHTLSRIDETPVQSLRPRSKSLQHSTDLQNSTDVCSTRPILRSRSNISADTSRSVPVCNQSQDVHHQPSSSPQYAEPKGYDYESGSSHDPQQDVSYDWSGERAHDGVLSMSDLPIMVPIDPVTGAYVPYPQYSRYHADSGRLDPLQHKHNKRKASKSNLYLAFMY